MENRTSSGILLHYLYTKRNKKTTGYINALKEGTIKLYATYDGAPWVWVWTFSIDGYASADLAAIGFMDAYFSSSLYILHEFGTKIYSTTSEGVTYYNFGSVIKGEPHIVYSNIGVIPSNATFVAFAHTHPNSNVEGFSGGDKTSANATGIDCYVVAQSLNVFKYDVSSNSTSMIGTTTLLQLTEQQKSELVTEFQASWNEHISYNFPYCPAGDICKRKTWPNQ